VIPATNNTEVIIGAISYFIQVMTCTVLSFYAIQVLSVKLVLESESHKILQKKA